jgi:uncharacterized protein (TIGR00369 family)
MLGVLKDKIMSRLPTSPLVFSALPALDVSQMLSTLFAPFVQALNLEVLSVLAGEARFRLPFSSHLCREGGSVCGQALMSAADTAMVFAICGQLGEFKPMTTVSLNSSFLRPVLGDAWVTARVIKPGRSLMFGAIDIENAEGALCAQATTTYALV